MAMVSLRVWFLTAFILWLKICHSYGQTFRVTQTSNESITVAWESVTTLVNFSIVLNSAEVYRGSGEAGSPREVVGLQPGSLYHLQVEALHENGTQLVLLNINKFTRPNQAENVETLERNTGSITVTWQGPSRGDLWYYTTKLQEVTSSERNVSKADRRATFTGLNAAGRYTVVIATVIGDETGNVVEKVIYTKPAAPTAALVTAYDTEMIVVTWTPASSNQNEVSFQVSYQVAGSVKTLTSCQVSGCALTMPKPGQSVTVFVVASISGINSDEVTATGNTKPLPPGYMLVSDRNTKSLTVTGLLPMLSSVSDNIMVQVTPSPSYPPQHRVSGANYSVTIHGLTPGTRYTITVETVSGRERSNSTVQTFYTRPAKPPAVTRHDTTTDTLTVTWSEPAAGMFTQYAISIRRNGTTTVIKKSKVSKSASRVEKFEGLQPGEMYEIILQTEISSVYSEPATSTFRTKPLKPQNVYVSVRNVNAFTISWEAPSGGTHTGYVAELVGMKTEQKVGGESIEFTELRPGTGYTCVLRTVSGDQMSDPQQDVFYTQPARPKWLNKTDVTSNSTTVEWGRPETGHYDGFRLTLQPDDQEVFLNESETSHRFTLLQSATRYTVKIAAKADTIYSSDVELIFTTRPKPPRNLHVVHQDTSSVGFVWDAPDQAVSVDAYRYTVTKSDSSQQADYVETTGSIHSATSTGLTSGGTYVIKVRAVKSGIESDPTDQLRLTLTPDNPGRLSASNVGQTSIELQWYDQSGDFDGFIVELKLDDTVVNKTQVGRSTKTVEIQDLLPERTYTALVYTVSNGKQSSGTSISVTTMSLGTVTLELEQRSTKSITVGWRQASGKVTHYELQVVPKDGGQTTTVIIQADKPQQHKFKDLQPGQTYVFTISIVASETKGAVSSRDITTKPLAVTSLTAEALDTATLRVQWGVLPDSIQREFQVQYKLQSGTTTNDLPVMYVSGQLTYTQDITSLAAGHTYDITVSAISNHISGAGQTVHNTTRPLPVASLQVEVLSPSVARLAWTGNQDSQQDHYQVRFKGDMLSTQWSSVQNVPDGTETNMTDLTPGDSYLFEVTAYSIDQWSDPVTETATMYPLPPSSVDVVTNETSTSRVKVRWTYEYGLKTYWSHWLVIYGRVGSVTTLSQTLRDTGLRTYTVDNLLAGYNYTIQVYTVTLDNVTSLSPTTVDATVKPVITTEMTETVEQTTTDTLALTYTEETGSGTFDHYTFSLQDSPPVVKDRGDLDRTVMFHQLEAGHRYWVVAQTVSGSEISSAKRLKVFTVPHPPEVTCVEEQDWISIVLNQADGSASQFDIVCGSCNDSRHHTIPSDEHSVRFRNLQPFTEYKFDVTSVVGDETTKSSVVRSIRCKTNEGRPQLVQEFSATNIKPYELTLTWREPLVKNGNLKEYIIKYNGSKQYAKDAPTGEIKLNETVHSQTIRSLKAGYTYTFEIRAYNSLSGDPAVLNVTLPVAAPYIALPDIAKATPTVINDSVTKSSFKMEFVNPFSDKNGAIIGYSIVVTTDTQHKDLKVADLPNWAHRKSDNAVLYVAVDKCRDLFSEGNTCWSSGVMKRSAPNDRVVVTVGGDSGCDENAIDPCNGKLSSDTTYYIRLRAYTEGNLFAETPFSKGVTTAVKPVNVVAIVIPVIVCVIFIIVVVVILVLRHRDTFSKKARPECPIFIGTLQQPAHRSKTDDSSRPIKLTDFSKHWKSMNADAQFKFAEEYEDLKEVGREQSITVAELPANRVKNRFSNILPYDSTRVRLLAGDEEEEEEGTDYINASWMPGYNSKREYIVAQGPLPSTRDDMWRVVWEQNVQSIVMLTKCVEKGRDKCDYYWPVDSEPMFYGDVQVMILNETKCTEWVVTEFKISSGGHSRHLKHFHYTAWPDFGVPEKPRSLIGFVRLVRSKLKTTEGPTIVHCSAGVGRSGTFIVLDRMLQHLLEHDYVDVFGTVYEMRKHRHWMVQTEQQYICIHRCLVYVIEDREFDDADSDGEANKAFEIDEGIES